MQANVKHLSLVLSLDRVGIEVQYPYYTMSKTYTNEKGHIIVSLPVEGVEVAFRSPKGKDLKAIELASKADDATNTGIMMLLIASLCVKFGDRTNITLDQVEDMNAEDVAVMGTALSNFRTFSNFRAE